MVELYDTVHRRRWKAPVKPAHTKYGLELIEHALLYGLENKEVEKLDKEQVTFLKSHRML